MERSCDGAPASESRGLSTAGRTGERARGPAAARGARRRARCACSCPGRRCGCSVSVYDPQRASADAA
eukprot:scaffold616_cov89-Phaeocystis_antarctica.AAC.9